MAFPEKLNLNSALARDDLDRSVLTHDHEFESSPRTKRIRAIVWGMYYKYFRPCDSLLDLNCGTGADAIELASNGMYVFGIDSSAEMIAILKKKIEEKKVDILDSVVELICRNVNTNVRDLEKALTKLIAYAELVNKNITIEIAKQQLKDFFAQPRQKSITIELIQKIVSDYFGLSYKDLRGKRRTKAVAFPRQMAMYLSRELTEYSTTEIGSEFGGRDHTTVMHACQKIDDRMKLDPNLDPSLQQLKKRIKETNA